MAVDLGYDEGGGGDKLLVSVQVGIYEQVKKLKRQWKRRLGALEYFHSKDFGNYTGGIFTKAGLDRNARHVLLKDLASLIHRHLLFAATSRVTIGEYDQLTTQKFRSRLGTAYSFAIDMCLLSAYSVVKEMGIKPEFNILIEKGHRNAGQVAQILDVLHKMPEEVMAASPLPDLKILTAGLGDKKDHPILQSADMVAYSDWQGLSHGDRTIWDALHRDGVRYRTWRVHCDAALIKEFVSEGSVPFIRRQRKRAKALHDAEQRVSEVRPNDAETDKGSTQRDRSETGSGESGEKEKAED